MPRAMLGWLIAAPFVLRGGVRDERRGGEGIPAAPLALHSAFHGFMASKFKMGHDRLVARPVSGDSSGASAAASGAGGETSGASAEASGAGAEASGANAETSGANAEASGASAAASGANAKTSGVSALAGAHVEPRKPMKSGSLHPKFHAYPVG